VPILFDRKISPSELRERLSAHYLPTCSRTFYTVRQIPLTPNGKIDRKALPAHPGEGTEEEIVPPKNKIEAH